MTTQDISINSQHPTALADLQRAFPDCRLAYKGKSYPGSTYVRFTMHFPTPVREAEFNAWVLAQPLY